MSFHTHKEYSKMTMQMYQLDTRIKTKNGNRPDLFIYNKRRKEITLIKVGIACQDKYRLSPGRRSVIIPQVRK